MTRADMGSKRGIGFRWGFILGLIVMVGALAIVAYSVPGGGGNGGAFFFQPVVLGLVGLLLVADVIYGVRANAERNGLIAGVVVALYLFAIYGELAAIV